MRFTAPVAVLLAFCALLAPACAQVDGSTVSAAVANVGSTAMHAMTSAGGAGSRKLQSVTLSCPSPSSGALTCNDGTQLLSYPGSGGVCDCNCGTNATTATDSTSGGNSAIVAVAGSSACTNAACTTAFPTFCPAARYVMAQYVNWTALGTQTQSVLTLTTTSCGTAAMCYGLDVQCSPSNIANGICPSFLAGTTIFQAGCWGASSAHGAGAAAQCAASSANTAALGLLTGAVVCNSNTCNTAANVKSASTAAAPAFALFALIATTAATWL